MTGVHCERIQVVQPSFLARTRKDVVSLEAVLHRSEQSMRRVAYRPGQFAQILLDDGKRLFLELRPNGLTVRRLALGGLLPTTLIWRYQSPFPLRKVGRGNRLGESLLEALIEAVEQCSGLNQVLPMLGQLGDFLDREFLDSFSSDEELPPPGPVDILRAYAAVLARCARENRGLLWPESMLPYPKDTIRTTIEVLLATRTDEEMGVGLQEGLDLLDDFIPDGEVPRDVAANMRLWAKRHERG